MKPIYFLKLVVLCLLGADGLFQSKCNKWFDGDYNLTKDNFEKVVSAEKYLLVSVTDSVGCVSCCGYESGIQDLWRRKFQNPKSQLSQHGIRLGRLDLAQETWFESLHPAFIELPSWVMYVSGKPYYLPNFNVEQKLLGSITRLVEPIQEISSLNSFERFVNLSLVDVTGREMIRHKVVGVFKDLDEYEDEIQALREGALASYWREDTVFGLVVQSKAAKQIWQKYGPLFKVDRFESDGVMYFQNPHRLAKEKAPRVALIADLGDIPAFIGRESIRQGEEFTSSSRAAMDPAIHTLFAFVDPDHSQASRDFLHSLENVVKHHEERLQFVWADYRDNLQLMKRLGVEGLQLPCVGLESPHGSEQISVLNSTFPRADKVAKFLEENLRVHQPGHVSHLVYRTVQRQLAHAESQIALLHPITLFDLSAFHSLLSSDTVTGLVYFFNSSSHSEQHALRANTLVQVGRFARDRLGLWTLLTAAYDLGRHRMPEDIFNDRNFEMNSVYLIPASQTKGPFLRFEGKEEDFTPDKVLRFALSHVEFKYEPNPEGITMTPEEEKMFGAGSMFEEINESTPNSQAQAAESLSTDL